MLTRHTEDDVVFKPSMARQMLAASISLYKWYRNRQSAVKSLGLVLPTPLDVLADGVDGLTSLRLTSTALPDGDVDDGEGTLMEETDAGGEASDNDEDGGPQVAGPGGNNHGHGHGHGHGADHGQGGAAAAANENAMLLAAAAAAADAAEDDDENLQLGESDDDEGGPMFVGDMDGGP